MAGNQPKKAGKKGKHPGGRPTDYKPEYARMAMEIIRHSGFSILKLSRVFDCGTKTVYNWMGEHPEFLHGINAGRKIFDGIGIERSLVRRATGYTYTETTKEPNSNGEMVITKRVKKHIAPDVAAIKHWQVNMQSERWKDKQEHEVTFPDAESLKIEFVSKDDDSDTGKT